MFQKTNAESNESASKESNFIVLKVHSRPDSERNWSGTRWFDILSVDPATDNIGFRIERRFHNGRIVKLFYERVDAGIEDNPNNKNIDVFKLMKRVYELKPLIEKCHICVFESQFAYYNVECQWFIIGVIGTIVRDNPLLTIMIAISSRLKTGMLGCPKDYNRNAIKKWGIVKAIEFCIRGRDFDSLNVIFDETKRDDISDALIQIVVALKILNLPEPPEFPTDLTPVTSHLKMLFDKRDGAERRKLLSQAKACCYQLIQQYPLEIPEDAAAELALIDQFRQAIVPQTSSSLSQTSLHTGFTIQSVNPNQVSIPQSTQQVVQQPLNQTTVRQQPVIQPGQPIVVQAPVQSTSQSMGGRLVIGQPTVQIPIQQTVVQSTIGRPVIQPSQQAPVQQITGGIVIGQATSQPIQTVPEQRIILQSQTTQPPQQTLIQPGIKINVPKQPVQQQSSSFGSNQSQTPHIPQQIQTASLPGLVLNLNPTIQQSPQQVRSSITPTDQPQFQDQKIEYLSDSDDEEDEGSLSPTEIQKRLETYQKMRQKPIRNPFLDADKEIKSDSVTEASFALKAVEKIGPISHGILGEVILPDPSLFRPLDEPSPAPQTPKTDQGSKLILTIKPATVHPKLVEAGVPATQKFDSDEIISAVYVEATSQPSSRTSSGPSTGSSLIETESGLSEHSLNLPLFPVGKKFEPPKPKDGQKYTVKYPIGVIINKSYWTLVPS